MRLILDIKFITGNYDDADCKKADFPNSIVTKLE